ncbi:tetratricopeptide repeat protein [Crocinitomix catalasitica]|nr:tetratricopeptide repeat protein [Crocinitomix catalasitica]
MKMSGRFIYFIIPVICFMLVTCGEAEEETETNDEPVSYRADPVQFRKDLSELEARLESQMGPPEEQDMKEAVTMFQDFAGIFPDDSEAPDYLFKASDLSLSLNMPEKSIKILGRIINEYPDYNRMEDVMFNKASHLDFEIRDTSRAKEAYKDFIAKYPNSDLVDDAESRIENIRYSLEELADKFIKELEDAESNPQ